MTVRRRIFGRAAAALTLGAGIAAVGAPVGSAAPPISAVSEYVESFPTSSGPHAGGPNPTSKLPAALQHTIAASSGRDASALTAIVSSGPRKGQKVAERNATAKPATSRRHVVRPARVSAPSLGSTLGATGAAIGRDGTLVGVVLVLLTAAAVFLRRRRS